MPHINPKLKNMHLLIFLYNTWFFDQNTPNVLKKKKINEMHQNSLGYFHVFGY